MAIIAICPGCKTRLTLSDERAGSRFSCPKCAKSFDLPASPTSVPIPKWVDTLPTSSAGLDQGGPGRKLIIAWSVAAGGVIFGLLCLVVAFTIVNRDRTARTEKEPDIRTQPVAEPVKDFRESTVMVEEPKNHSRPPLPKKKIEKPKDEVPATPKPADVPSKPEPPKIDAPKPAPPIVAELAPSPRDRVAELKTLIAELKDTDGRKRCKALEKIALYGPLANEIGEDLIEAMRDKNESVRNLACDTFEKVNPRLYPHVFTLLYGQEKKVAIESIHRLGADAKATVPLLLEYQDKPELWYLGGDIFRFIREDTAPDLFPIVAKIAPTDKRFAAAVLKSISNPMSVSPKLMTPDASILKQRYHARAFGLRQLDVIDATPLEKVDALIPALDDANSIIPAITALQELGKNSAAALPKLKKLKFSPNDTIRNAAAAAIKKIE